MKKTKKALASLAIAGMTLSMIPFNVFAASPVNRIAGVTAEQTAVQIAEQTGYTGTAILASSTSYGMVDALTAGPLAASLKAPILLTGAGSSLDAATKAELTKLAVKKVYVTSGTAVIKQSVIDELKGMGIEVEALGGFDRSETSVNIAKKMTGVTKVAVANTVVDALSIAAVASAANEPILLTDRDALPASVAAYLASAGVTASDVIGGTGVISDAVAAKLPSAARHAGMSAYDTNNKVIQDFAGSLKFDTVYVANGVTGIDALAGAPLAAQTQSPIVLTDGKTVPQAAAFTYSKSPASAVVTALGGEFVVPESVRAGVAAGAVTPDSNELKIVSVSALNDTNSVLEFSFTKAVSSLSVSDITIQNASTLARYGVQSVNLASDGKSAQVQLIEGADNANVLAYLTDYAIKLNANGTMLTYTFNRPAYIDKKYDAHVTAVDSEEREITITTSMTAAQVAATGIPNPVTLEVPEEMKFNFQEALGQDIRVWFNGDDEVVKYVFETESVLFDAVEVTKTATVNVATDDTTGGELELNKADKKYDLANDVEFYLDGDKQTGTDLRDALVDAETYDSAKLILNSSGDVKAVYAFNWDGDPIIVDSVDEDYVVGLNDEIDLEDYIIIKDGKQIAASDIKEGDILHYNADAYDDGFAEIYAETVTGTITDAFVDDFEVDGVSYDYDSALSLDSDGDVQDFRYDEADDLDGAEVTLYLNREGEVVFVSTDAVADTDETSAAYVTATILGYQQAARDYVEIEYVDAAGTEYTDAIRLENLEKITYNNVEYDIDSTPDATEYSATLSGGNTVIDLKLAGVGGAVASINLAGSRNTLINVTKDDEGVVTELEFFSAAQVDTIQATKLLESDDSYIETTANGNKKLSKDVVIFDKNGEANPDVDDLIIKKFADLGGNDITSANIYFDENAKVVGVISITDTAEDTTDQEILVTATPSRNSDNEVTRLKGFVAGVEKTYIVDDAAFGAISKGDVVTISVDDNTGEVTAITSAAALLASGKTVADLNTADDEITTNQGDIYEMADGFKVYDISNTSDISVESKTELDNIDPLTQSITVVYENSGNTRYIQAVLIDDVAEAALPTVSGYALALNAADAETITLDVSEKLDLADGAAVTGFTTSTGTIASAVYDADSNTIVITATADGDFTAATTVTYTQATGNVVDMAGNELAAIVAHAVI